MMKLKKIIVPYSRTFEGKATIACSLRVGKQSLVFVGERVTEIEIGSQVESQVESLIIRVYDDAIDARRETLYFIGSQLLLAC